MRLFPFCLAALLVLNLRDISLSKTTGEDDRVASLSEAKADLLFHPLPKYPIAELRKYHQGKGSYLINFNRDTGAARGVTIVKSAGSEYLDKTVTETLRRWRARPHTLDKVFVPVSFTMAGEKEQQTLRQAGDNVLESPYPKFPLSVRWEHPGGKGIFRLQIDRKSGLVTSVQTLRTMGDNRLDAAALEALRTWRFKPQTLSELVVPIEF
jgi:TonB family protein